MDGIDGIAGVEAVTVAGGAALMLSLELVDFVGCVRGRRHHDAHETHAVREVLVRGSSRPRLSTRCTAMSPSATKKN